MVDPSDAARHEIVCTSTGYHPFSRRKVGLSLEHGVLVRSEGGQTGPITRAEWRPIRWVGQGKMRPLVPLPGFVLEGPEGPWVVVANDMTIDLERADEHVTPHPHVWIGGDDLARMAGALGVGSVRKPAPVVQTPGGFNPINWVLPLLLGGAVLTASLMFAHWRTPTSLDCSRQRGPATELYPRLSCAEARIELARVARGEASPRTIVLRPLRLEIDAKDVTGPAKVTCDGVEFAAENAGQADPSGPIVYANGPHAVLAGVRPDGRLSGLQTVVCGNVVAGERLGAAR